MSLSHSPRIVTDGLVLALDAANTKSYVGSGNTWTDLSGKGNNGTINGAVHFGPNRTVSSAYSVSAVNGGTADFTSPPDLYSDSPFGSSSTVFSNIFAGDNNTFFYNATTNFDVTVTLRKPITYTSTTVAIFHATLNAVDFITTAGTVSASPGGSSTGSILYIGLLPPGGTLTAIRFYTDSGQSDNTVGYINIDGELLNLFKPTPQISSYFDFDGSNDYISITNNSLPTGDYTINCWVKTPSVIPVTQYDMIISTSQNFWYLGIYLDKFTIDNNDGTFRFGSTLSASTWYNVTVTRSGSTDTAYINGISQGTNTNSAALSGNWEIGRWAYSPNHYWNSNIASVSIYNKALTPQEIQQNYNALKGRYTT